MPAKKSNDLCHRPKLSFMQDVVLTGTRRTASRPSAAHPQAPWSIDAIERTVAHIRAHLDQRLALEDLARIAGLSVWRFATVFRLCMGEPPHRFICGLRVRHAQNLLREGMPTASVANEAGFYDQSHLSSHFKSVCAMTPGQYQGGGRAMVEAGLFDRFPCDAVYALHNWPELPLGTAQTRPGPIMAAADRFDIVVEGRGGHAAQPHRTPDALLAASELLIQLNTIVSRRIDPTAAAVLSVTRMQGGQSHNVLPARVELTGTVRTFDAEVQDRIEAAVRQVAQGVALGSGTRIEVKYVRYYPATVNTPAAAEQALAAAAAVGLRAALAPNPAFTSEDFAFMLKAGPGAYLWLGQGRANGHPLHHPAYDFNDDALGYRVAWLTAVAERALDPANATSGA